MEKTKHSKASSHFIKVAADNVCHRFNNLFVCQSVNINHLSEHPAKLGLAQRTLCSSHDYMTGSFQSPGPSSMTSSQVAFVVFNIYEQQPL